MARGNGHAIDYDTLVKPGAVHGGCYINPDIFAGELKRIYGRGWVYVGHQSEILNAGDYVRKWIGLHREQVDNEGTANSQGTDETSQRGMWRHWKMVMQQEISQ